MAKEKNIATNEFVKQNEVFADIVNYAIYDGKQIVKAADLTEKSVTENLLWNENEKIIGKEMARDVLKSCVIKQDAQVTYVIIGIENQTEINTVMPVRNLLYDTLSYARQIKEISIHNKKEKRVKTSGEFLSGFCQDDKLVPVITITVCYDPQTWYGAKTLKEMLYEVDPCIMKYVPDYKICLISPSQIYDYDKFRTDFGTVMKFMAASKDKVLLQQLFMTDREKLANLGVRASEALNVLLNLNVRINEGGYDMLCKGMEDWLKDEREEGKAEGVTEGLKEGTSLLAQAIRYVRSGDDTLEKLEEKGIPEAIAKTALELG